MKRLLTKGRKGKLLKLTILLCTLLSFMAFNFQSNLSGITSELIQPVFAQSVDATFLQKEAGISLYANLNTSLDLSIAKSVFKTIEKETLTYIIGSVSLPGLPETDDPHVFVHKDGWIVVYYLRSEPLAKIINWNKLESTKLEEGLLKIHNVLNVPFIEAKYFDFRYTVAEKLMVIIDDDSYKIKIPSSFVIYELSYSANLYGYSGWYSSTRASFLIDSTEIAFSYTQEIKVGLLTLAQLKPDIFHTIECKSAKGAVVLAYKEG
jgi:hypothetical protein